MECIAGLPGAKLIPGYSTKLHSGENMEKIVVEGGIHMRVLTRPLSWSQC